MAYSKQTFIANQILTAAEMNQVEENVAQVRKFEIGASAPSVYEAGVGWIYNGATPWVFRVAESGSVFLDAFHINATANEIRPVLPSSATTNSLGAITSSHEAFESATISSLSNLETATGTSLAAITNSHEALVSSYDFFEANFATDLYSAIFALVDDI